MQFVCSSEKHKKQQCIKLPGCTISNTMYIRKKSTLSPIMPHKCYVFGGHI